MPKVSVIVPIYGVEKYLKEAIESILNQTMKDLEIILIDDGSRDMCPEIIDEYAQKDNRIIAIHKQNGGYGQSMNVGLERATGEYIAILEPDDYIDSKMYEDLYSIAKKYDSDIVKSCFYENLQCKQETKIKKIEWNDFVPEDRSFTIIEYPYFLCYHPSVWSCIYKREFLYKNKIRFVEAPGSGWTDNPFQVQTVCLAEKINYTSKAYYYWRVLNYYASDDLKDYTIPFKRSDEIHKWLEENNIYDNNILANLYKRELAYIKIVLGMKNIGNNANCYQQIKAMCNRMNDEIIFKNKYIDSQDKKVYSVCMYNPQTLRLQILFKRYRKDFIQIRWHENEHIIRFMGGNLYYSVK